MNIEDFVLDGINPTVTLYIVICIIKAFSLLLFICTLIIMCVITTIVISKNIEYLSTPMCLFLISLSLLGGFIFGINNFGDKTNGT